MGEGRSDWASKKRELHAFRRTIVEPERIGLFDAIPMLADPGQLACAAVRIDYRVQQPVKQLVCLGVPPGGDQTSGIRRSPRSL